jgi:hypothetical protein
MTGLRVVKTEERFASPASARVRLVHAVYETVRASSRRLLHHLVEDEGRNCQLAIQLITDRRYLPNLRYCRLLGFSDANSMPCARFLVIGAVLAV